MNDRRTRRSFLLVCIVVVVVAASYSDHSRISTYYGETAKYYGEIGTLTRKKTNETGEVQVKQSDEDEDVSEEASANNQREKNILHRDKLCNPHHSHQTNVFGVSPIGPYESLARGKKLRPPIDVLIGYNGTERCLIQRNLSPLLDFAIIGHSKCGTSSLSEWFRSNPDIAITNHEGTIFENGPIQAVKKVYGMFRNNTKFKATKKPADINNPISMTTLRTYFPQTKVIVSIRHPVLWFQSFYNFWNAMSQPAKKGRNMKRVYLPHNTSELIGPCIVNKHVCTDHARFHLQIARALHPTPMTSAREIDLLGETVENTSSPSCTNPVYFLEISQLSDWNETRSSKFREDLRQFLGIKHTFQLPPHVNDGTAKVETRKKKGRHTPTINICDDAHSRVRQELMIHSRNMAAWIREFLFQSERVSMSSKDYIDKLMESYMHDPCD